MNEFGGGLVEFISVRDLCQIIAGYCTVLPHLFDPDNQRGAT